MTYPLVDAGFTLWFGDVETHLKRVHNVSIKDLGLDRRSLADRYYAGDTVFAFLDRLSATLGALKPA